LAKYNPKDWFGEIPVIGKMSPAEAAKKILELGKVEEAKKIKVSRKASFSVLWWPGSNKPKPWQHTSHAFGFIPIADVDSSKLVDISHAGSIQPELGLKDSRIKITLDRLRVFDYPGDGIHHILFDFYAQNQVQGQTENLHFNQIYRVQEGEQAGIIGYPTFVGLHVGSEGVAFKCYTVNVKNEDDQKVLEFLDNDIFKNGLKLIDTVNPVIPVISSFAIGFTKMMATRNQNVPVQDFFMGLDFTKISTRARLAQGSYIAVQIPDAGKWDWSKWKYNPINGQIVSANDLAQTIPYNYLVFSVSKYQ